MACRGVKHYSQQSDYAGFDGGAGRDQPEAASSSDGGCSDLCTGSMSVLSRRL